MSPILTCYFAYKIAHVNNDEEICDMTASRRCNKCNPW
uniref:Uncharacterized protein n=1 Tax=Anguilla anguilla TaxID=7936 RepID=A0A0E9U1U4_ANGAN